MVIDLLIWWYRWFWPLTALGCFILFLGYKTMLWVSGASDENRALDGVDKNWNRDW